MLHLYAMLLLAQWRDTRAYRPLAELGHLDEATVDTVFGQLVHDSYGRALASCCDGDIAPLTQLADDDGASFWARAAALEALFMAALESRAPPARRQSPSWPTSAPAKPSSCATSPTPAPISEDVLDFLVVCLADLGAIEHLPAIQEWFAAGLVDESYLDQADIEADIRRSPAECCATSRIQRHAAV